MQKDERTTANDSAKVQSAATYDAAMDNFHKKEVPLEARKSKYRWVGPVVLLLAVGIGVYFIISMALDMQGGSQSFSQAFGSIRWQNALIAVAVVLGIMVLDSAKFSIILHATTRKFHPLIGAKTSFLGKYYDGITPFATGGQPMQIIYLYQKGLSGGTSTAVALIRYSFNKVAALAVGFSFMVFNTATVQSNLVLIAGWIGWSINACLPLIIVLFIVMPNFARKATAFFVNLGYKMRFVKNKDKVVARAYNAVNDFRSSFIIMAKHPAHMVFLILTCALETALTYSVPFFIITMFNGYTWQDPGVGMRLVEIMSLNAYVTFGASVVPTPGGSGALEGLMSAAFNSVDSVQGTFMWVMFTWRFAVFYVYILVGVGITLFNLIRNLVRQKRAAKLGISVDEMLGHGPLPSTFDAEGAIQSAPQPSETIDGGETTDGADNDPSTHD